MSELLIEIVNDINALLEHLQDEVKIEHKKVRSFSECPECGERINNGYFKLIKNATKSVFLSYDIYHNMSTHIIYDKEYGATDKDVNELLKENSKKSPRDQLSIDEIESQISKYSLEKLGQVIKTMTTDRFSVKQ